jgi:uncharacterized membrane protein HdeD (DUF308 family)
MRFGVIVMSTDQFTDMDGISLAEAEKMSRNWWVLLVNGILAIIAGILILSIPWTIRSLELFFGAYLIVRGVLQAFSPPRAGRSQGWNIAIGILSLIVGIAIISIPSFALLSLLTLAIFIGIWLIITGVFETVASISNRATVDYWWLGAIGGVLSVILGFFALYRPLLTLAALVLVVGIWAIVTGIMEIILSFEIKNLPKSMQRSMAPEMGPRKIA